MEYTISNISTQYNRYSYIDCIITDSNNKILDSDIYSVGGNCEEMRIVKINNKYTFIKNGDHKIPNDREWYDYCINFDCGYGIVAIGPFYNFINRDFKLVSPNLWFDVVIPFCKTTAIVGKNSKYGLIDGNGKLLLDIIYDDINYITYGIRIDIKLYNKVYTINNKLEVI